MSLSDAQAWQSCLPSSVPWRTTRRLGDRVSSILPSREASLRSWFASPLVPGRNPVLPVANTQWQTRQSENRAARSRITDGERQRGQGTEASSGASGSGRSTINDDSALFRVAGHVTEGLTNKERAQAGKHATFLSKPPRITSA